MLNFSIVDINGPNQTGFSVPQGFYDKGSRYSASKAFLSPVKDRPNLDILLDTRVTKILFNSKNETNRAIGVAVQLNGKTHVIRIVKEVIISAGAFGSPQLLMLSGLGPRKDLLKFGIKPLFNLSVGRNLQDHIAGLVPFTLSKSISLRRKRLVSLGALYQYALWGTGPLTTFGGVEGIGFAKTK